MNFGEQPKGISNDSMQTRTVRTDFPNQISSIKCSTGWSIASHLIERRATQPTRASPPLSPRAVRVGSVVFCSMCSYFAYGGFRLDDVKRIHIDESLIGISWSSIDSESLCWTMSVCLCIGSSHSPMTGMQRHGLFFRRARANDVHWLNLTLPQIKSFTNSLEKSGIEGKRTKTWQNEALSLGDGACAIRRSMAPSFSVAILFNFVVAENCIFAFGFCRLRQFRGVRLDGCFVWSNCPKKMVHSLETFHLFFVWKTLHMQQLVQTERDITIKPGIRTKTSCHKTECQTYDRICARLYESF